MKYGVIWKSCLAGKVCIHSNHSFLATKLRIWESSNTGDVLYYLHIDIRKNYFWSHNLGLNDNKVQMIKHSHLTAKICFFTRDRRPDGYFEGSLKCLCKIDFQRLKCLSSFKFFRSSLLLKRLLLLAEIFFYSVLDTRDCFEIF